MAQKLGFWRQWAGGEWADRNVINANAQELENVEFDLNQLRALVKRQAQELLYLRAMFSGLIEVLHEQQPFHEGKLEQAVQSAWAELNPAPAQPKPTAPAPVRIVTCAACGRQVPATRTNITATGEVCDACT